MRCDSRVGVPPAQQVDHPEAGRASIAAQFAGELESLRIASTLASAHQVPGTRDQGHAAERASIAVLPPDQGRLSSITSQAGDLQEAFA